MLTLLALLTVAGAADAPDARLMPGVDHDLQGRRLQQARDLRTAGAVLSVVGPPAALTGLALVAVAALGNAFGSGGNNQGVAVLGVVIGGAGLVGSVVGPPLLLGGGHLADRVAWIGHGIEVPGGLGTLSGVLFVGAVVSLFVAAGASTQAIVFVVPAGLWVGGVTTGVVWANGAIRAGEGRATLGLAPMWTPSPGSGSGAFGVVVSGRF